MSDEFLGDRRQALENEFFQKQNEALLQELRRAHETEERREALRGETIERARAVAKATGGFLGFGNKISDEEESVLTALEAAFSGS